MNSEEEEGVKASTRRVKLPRFKGVDPQGWVSRAEKFFEVKNISAEKLKFAVIGKEGSANHWLKFWRQKAKNKNHSWEEFIKALIQRFGRRERNSIFESLTKIKQQGSMEDYI